MKKPTKKTTLTTQEIAKRRLDFQNAIERQNNYNHPLKIEYVELESEPTTQDIIEYRKHKEKYIAIHGIQENKILSTMVSDYKKIKYIVSNAIYTTSKELTIESFSLAIAKHCLKKLASKGNLNAYDLYTNQNKTICIEDLTQDIALYLCENIDKWEIINNRFECESQDFFISIFTIVSHNLYQAMQKHYKNSYICLDDSETLIRYNDIQALSDYVCIDKLLENVELKAFMDTLQPLDKQWLELRLQGLSNAKISNALGVTYEKIRAIEKRVRKAYTEKK